MFGDNIIHLALFAHYQDNTSSTVTFQRDLKYMFRSIRTLQCS